MECEKIMIVDDNRDFLDELKETLYLCGYDVTAVPDSSSVLNAARKIKPDVILLDLRMSKMNGFQVAEELKRLEETSGIPIIAMSGYFPLEKQSVLLEMGNMDGRIKKPFTILDLVTQIERTLSRGKYAAKDRGSTVNM